MSRTASAITHAARRLARSPGYGAALIVTLALGIAISVVAFSILSGVIYRSLPYPDQDRVVLVESANPSQGVSNGNLTPAQAETFAGTARGFEALGYYMWGGVTLMHGGRPVELTTNRVSADYFRALGVSPRLGRFIQADDIEAGEAVAVLSYETWRRFAGGSPDVVGDTLQTTNGPVRVAGVMPPEFRFPAQDVGMWLALQPQHLDPESPAYWNARYINAVGRRAPGTSFRAAGEELAVIDAAVRERYGISDLGWKVTLNPVLDSLVGDVRWVLWGVFGVSILVLLIACANVAALVAARLAERRHQLAIALAVGATRGRLRAELSLELLLAGAIAAAAGAAIAFGAVEIIRELAVGHVPRADEITLGWPALAFAISTALAVPFLVLALGAGAGLPTPAHAREQGHGLVGTRDRRLRLPVLGIALSTTALIAAAALALSLAKLTRVEPGYRLDGVQALQLFRGGGPDEWRRFAIEAGERMAALPGVERVAVTTAAPQSLVGSFTTDVQVPERDLPEPLQANLRRVDPGYLPLLDIPLVAGRNFRDGDDQNAPRVAIVSETLARRVFGELDPIGRELALPLGNGPRVPVRIVGVSRDVKNAGLRSAPEPEVLVPFDQFPWVGMTFLVRAPGALSGLDEQLQSVVWELDPEEGITRVFELREDVDAQARPLRFFATAVTAFAVASVCLGAFGVYSVLAFVQRRRVRELGMRLALGASPSRLFGLVMTEGARILALGLAGGALGAVGLLRLLESQLFGMGALPWAAVASGGLAMVLAAIAAAALPAWRAARVNPVEALRHE